MPPWLILVLMVLGSIVWVGLLAAGCMGSWRAFWTGAKQYSLYLLILFIIPSGLVAGVMYIVR